MPRLSVWFIRASLIYLVLGFTFGGLLLFNKGYPFYPSLWQLLPSHIEFVFLGWTVQLVLGMAFWILPRFSTPPVRGNEKLAWWAFIMINTGLLALILASLGQGNQWLSLAGKVLEAAGILVFAIHAWPRIKSFGNQ